MFKNSGERQDEMGWKDNTNDDELKFLTGNRKTEGALEMGRKSHLGGWEFSGVVSDSEIVHPPQEGDLQVV